MTAAAVHSAVSAGRIDGHIVVIIYRDGGGGGGGSGSGSGRRRHRGRRSSFVNGEMNARDRCI